MAIIKGSRNIKVTVPRHSSQTIGAKLDSEIKRQAKEKSIRVDTAQPSAELAQAIESASEWNSLLITARAERGPQWDIGTQQFLVEEHSELYYDPTPIFEVVKKTNDEEFGVSEPPQQPHPLQQHPQHPHASPHHGQFNPMNSGQRHQTPMRDREFHSQMGGQHMDPRHAHGAGPPMQASFPYGPNTPMRPPPGQGGFPGGGGPGMGGGGMQGQFFGGNSAPSPMRMGSMGGMGMDDGMGHPGMGGMGGMGMGGMQGVPGGPPGMARRMASMGQEGFMPQ